MEEVHWRRDGTSFPVSESGPSHVAGGQAIGAVVAFVDITSARRRKRRSANLAYFDTLTTLPNRRLPMDRLSQALIASSRSREFGALLILDLDNFKALNARRARCRRSPAHRGRAAAGGQACARRIRCSRLGGDEYVVMVEGLGPDETAAASQAEIIRRRSAARSTSPYAFRQRAAAPQHFQHRRDARPRAGAFHRRPGSSRPTSLYQAKAAGRNAIRSSTRHAGRHRTRAQADGGCVAQWPGAGELQLFTNPDRRMASDGAEACCAGSRPIRHPCRQLNFIHSPKTSASSSDGLMVMQTACAHSRPGTGSAHA